MLAKFSVKNFRGFTDRIELDLTRHSNYNFSTYAIKDDVIKNGIIYGPNGSGKTNFGLAIFDIVNHLTQKWKKADYYVNFTYAGSQTIQVEFDYTFIFGGQTVEYRYSKDYHGLLRSEEMLVNGKELFKREAGKFHIDVKEFPMDPMFQKNLADNANNVSIVNFLLTSYPLAADHYLLQLQKFVNGMLWFRSLDIREFIGLESNTTMLDEYIIRHKLIDDFRRFLLNVSGQDFKFANPNPGDKILFCEINKKRIPFDLIASTGTQHLKLLYFWMSRMRNATFVFIDEFDAFYHFKLSFEVCKRLFALSDTILKNSSEAMRSRYDIVRF